MPNLAPEIRLWINGKELTERIVQHIVGFSFKESLEATSKLSLTLAEYDDFDLTFDDLQFRTSVDCSIGYHKQSLALFSGEIETIKVAFPQYDKPSIEIIALDRSYLMKREPAPAMYTATRFPNLLAVAEKIIKSHGLTPYIDPVSALQKYTLQGDQAIEQINETDWEMLVKMSKTRNLRTFCRGNTVFMVDDEYIRNQQRVAYTFVYNPKPGQLEEGKYRMPLLDFRPTTSSRGQRTKVQLIAWSSVSDEGTVTGDASLASERLGGQVNYTDLKVKANYIDTIRVQGICVKTPEQAKALAIAEMEKRSEGFITGDAKIIGTPEVRIGEYHELIINGLTTFGQQFSGAYNITDVTHNYSIEDGYITEFSVRRPGLTLV